MEDLITPQLPLRGSGDSDSCNIFLKATKLFPDMGQKYMPFSQKFGMQMSMLLVDSYTNGLSVISQCFILEEKPHTIITLFLLN